MDFDSEVLEREPGLDSDNDNDPPLAHQAAASGDVALLVQAIKQDPGILEHRDTEGCTPLACAVQSQQLHAVKRLVKMGADIDSQDASGRTCLSVAAYQGWNEGVMYLLRKGATQSISDKSGRTPLHASTYDTDSRTLSSLLQRLSLSEINQTDNEKMTALHWAAFHNRPEHLRYLIQRGANTLTQDIDGKTPLHWAAQNGCRSCCALLAENDPDFQLVQCTDNSGKTALHLAAAAGHHRTLQELAQFLQSLYEAEDQDDRTPLHWAAAMGHADCVRTLLKLGVSPNPLDIDGGSPLEYAKQAGHAQCVELLEDRLGLKKYNYVKEREKESKKIDKPSKSAMNFFKGLFSKQQKRNTNDKKSVQSNLALPALSVRNEVRIGDVSSYDKSNVTQLNGRNKTVHRQVSSTSDMIHGSKHLSDSTGIDNQSFADNDTSSSNKPKRHRRKKKDRHKQSIEELSRSITYKTESSCNDITLSTTGTNNTNLKSMHLSPLGEDVGTVQISPRTSNENDRIILNQEGISSKRVGELNPLRTGRQLNGIRDVPLPNTLSKLRLSHEGKSRSPTPPPALISLNARKALPEISPLSVSNDSLHYDQKRMRKKYREATQDTYRETEDL